MSVYVFWPAEPRYRVRKKHKGYISLSIGEVTYMQKFMINNGRNSRYNYSGVIHKLKNTEKKTTGKSPDCRIINELKVSGVIINFSLNR